MKTEPGGKRSHLDVGRVVPSGSNPKHLDVSKRRRWSWRASGKYQTLTTEGLSGNGRKRRPVFPSGNTQAACSSSFSKSVLLLLQLVVFAGSTLVPGLPAEAAGETGWADVLPSNNVQEEIVAGGSCGGHVNNATFDFNQVGNYSDPDSASAFSGQTHVRVEAEEHYRFDAWGTRAANYTCANPLGVNDPETYWVSASITVAGSGVQLDSFPSCTLDGAFRRIAITTMMIEGRNTAACTFDGAAVAGTGTIPAGTLFQWVLETLPCGFPLSEDPEELFPCNDDPAVPAYIQGGLHTLNGVGPPPPAPDPCDVANAADDPAVNETQTPECIQDAIYVALGDSYSSGEGLAEDARVADDASIPRGSYTTDSTSSVSDCHRHPNAYSSLYMHSHNGSPYPMNSRNFAFYACSGAIADDVWNPRKKKPTIPPQIQHPDIGDGTKLVSLTIGGNDADFSKVITACIVGYAANPGVGTAACYGLIQAKKNEINSAEFSTALTQAFQAVKDRAVNAKIVAMGYPKFFPSSGGFLSGQNCPKLALTFAGTNQDEINEGIALLNSKISAAAAAVGISYNPIQPTWDGHEICGSQGEEWLNHLTWRDTTEDADQTGWRPTGKASFHPNYLGHEGYATDLDGYLGSWS